MTHVLPKDKNERNYSTELEPTKPIAVPIFWYLETNNSTISHLELCNSKNQLVRRERQASCRMDPEPLLEFSSNTAYDTIPNEVAIPRT